ncbi:MAG: DUF58 domain-containing protein [Puniceicoccales bacterium]|jgi:uncharacterized protein (DUF58 family)|nr:DUF58 domain-containing protein [Puniceicoccales bacterium]
MHEKNILPQLYRRTFRPNGVVLGDAREYVPGDDTRFINWYATAKAGVPFVDGIRSDSGADIVFAVDVSASMKFGTRKRSKMALAIDIVEALSQLAKANSDRVGLVLFSDSVEKYLPPRRSGQAFRNAVEEIANSDRRLRTNLPVTLKFLDKIVKKRSAIILICDTFCLASHRKLGLGYLHLLQTKHAVTLLAIGDGNDMPCPQIGKITIEDAESGDAFEIDTDDVDLIAKVREKYATYEKMILEDARAIGVGVFQANTGDSIAKFLLAFFKRRA